MTLSALFSATILAVALAPILAAGAAALDILSRDRRWSRIRLLRLVVGALLVELAGVVGSVGYWIVSGCGLFRRRRWTWRLHRRYMGWYTSTLLGLIVRALGTGIEWRDKADLERGPVVLIARHTSFFDALIPATVLARHNALLPHHVVTKGLRNLPCIDIVGNRFPNEFVDRAPTRGGAGLPAIRRLGGLLDDRSAAVIFPESTFRTPDRHARALERIERRSPVLAARARELQHMLPPRPSGTHALLAGCPNADLVVCVHTGFEEYGSLKAILALRRADRPVVVETWRIDRSEIPDDPDAFSSWLYREFARMDSWVDAQNRSA